MANQLTMAWIDTIKRLDQQGWSQREIARELEIDRGTVSRYLLLDGAPKPAIADGAPSDSKPATGQQAPSDASVADAAADLNERSQCTSPTVESLSNPSTPLSASQCAPFHESIVAKLDQGLSAQRIWQDLVSEHGFGHQYPSVRRYVAKLGASWNRATKESQF